MGSNRFENCTHTGEERGGGGKGGRGRQADRQTDRVAVKGLLGEGHIARPPVPPVQVHLPTKKCLFFDFLSFFRSYVARVI